jgi:hypoxanthine phosphoribosyltransferase
MNLQIDNLTFEPFLSEERIQERISQLAKDIHLDYVNKRPIFICVLNGAFVFFSDLLKQVGLVSCEVDFLQLSSYGDERISSGNVSITKNLRCQIEGRDIIVVEDIVDTGASLLFIKHLIEKGNPSSLRFVSLLMKPFNNVPFPIDYIGFKISSEFVIGYGLDYKQQYRNLTSIYRVREKE